MSEIESLSIFTGLWQSRFIGRTGDAYAPDINITLLEFFMEQLSHTLSTDSFSCLTGLQLSLPCTHDFLVLGKALPESLLLRIKRLFLAVMDATGPGGSRQYTRWTDAHGDGDTRYPLSNLQQRYPNREYTYAMFDIAARCQNLEILGLECSHRLDCDLLSLSTSKLSSLYLQRMTASVSKLIELLSPSTLSRLWIEGIELTSGTWAEVFIHLQNCEKLEYLNPSNCSYARGGSSIHLRAWNGRLWEDTTNLWSIHAPDESTLVNLVERLTEKAGGRENYPDLNMEQSVLPWIDDTDR
ncbi:hypothetical protein EG329_013451 [Mollisiaceae sp. DMI_Dod_QoI]|nr:hypothetical protein EG329_013451 [Helotiales sp. DMI_Dod_QoI]